MPPHARSRFTSQCDLGPKHQELLGRAPDFHIYYSLAHYHALGTGLTIDALQPDGTPDTVFTTTTRVGDALGGTLDPAFTMAGHSAIRFSCDFDNPRDSVVRWGYGDQEMCVFLAFTDSPYVWGAGVDSSDPGPPVDDQGVASFFKPCTVIAVDGSH